VASLEGRAVLISFSSGKIFPLDAFCKPEISLFGQDEGAIAPTSTSSGLVERAVEAFEKFGKSVHLKAKTGSPLPAL